MREFYHKLDVFFTMSFCNAFLLSSVRGSHHEEGLNKARSHRSIEDSKHKLNHELRFDIQLHGLILWVSMGLLMPLGILTIRMSGRFTRRATRFNILFYLHVVLQTLSLLLATGGAILSLKKFENLFNNSHQRIGLALYIAIWVQALIGIFRPLRGKKERSMWYIVHWMLGTIISLVGIINIYSGLNAYHKKTSTSTGLWTVLFTLQITFIGFIYLFQDKWEFLQKQRVVLEESEQLPVPTSDIEQEIQNSKDLSVLPCTKQNALKNLFD